MATRSDSRQFPLKMDSLLHIGFLVHNRRKKVDTGFFFFLRLPYARYPHIKYVLVFCVATMLLFLPKPCSNLCRNNGVLALNKGRRRDTQVRRNFNFFRCRAVWGPRTTSPPFASSSPPSGGKERIPRFVSLPSSHDVCTLREPSGHLHPAGLYFSLLKHVYNT